VERFLAIKKSLKILGGDLRSKTGPFRAAYPAVFSTIAAEQKVLAEELSNELTERIDTPLISFGGTTMPSGGLLMSSTVVGVETPLPLATAAAILSSYVAMRRKSTTGSCQLTRGTVALEMVALDISRARELRRLAAFRRLGISRAA
jgi:hypothetical protein